MRPGQEQCVDIAPFRFRISPEDVAAYRCALGAAGERVPFGLALRAASSEPVLAAVREIAGNRHPIHVAQECRAEQPLRAGVDYVCDIRLVVAGADRLRIEQRLSDPSGHLCLTSASDIALVAP